MKLYSGPLSLFSGKVEIALSAKGLSFERIMVPFNQTVGYSPKHPEVLAVIPDLDDERDRQECRCRAAVHTSSCSHGTLMRPWPIVTSLLMFRSDVTETS